MTGRFRILLLGVILTSVSFIVCATSMTMLFFTAMGQQRERLVETAQSQARLIESIARFNAVHHEEWHPDTGTPEEYTLSQIRDAHDNYEGFGKTGEFTLSKREGNNIVFLLSHRHFDLDNPKPVPFDSELAEPMRLALSGKSGTIIGLDYRGVKVLAAHEPVGELNLGIVAKIDLSEIRKPFLRATLISILVMFFTVFIGILLFYKITNPVIAALKENEERFRELYNDAPVGYMEIDIEGRITNVNRKELDMLGYTYEEVVGKYLSDFIAEEAAGELIKAILHEKEPPARGSKRNLRRKDGSTIPILIDDILVNNLSGNIAGMRCIHIDVSEIQKVEEEREKLIKSLEDALSEVKTLSGLLPICAHCKKIRDDKGYWKQIESYVQEHSEAEFSHSICRECADKYYPDIDIYDDEVKSEY